MNVDGNQQAKPTTLKLVVFKYLPRDSKGA